MSGYAVLVNTCDRFEDCWEPFFKLFSQYWPDYKGKIYLNTEYKDFSYPGLDIVPLKVCAAHNVPKTRRAAWSQCLIWALDMVQEQIILYMQEDYFLKDNVKGDIVEEYADLMDKELHIENIQLTDVCDPSGAASGFPHLCHAKKGPYLVCTQAALWRKDCLRSLLRRYESAWNFEWWGSKRAAIKECDFYVVDKQWVRQGEFEIVPYIFTGVVGGRWFPPVVELFDSHDIHIDYSRRGFHRADRKLSLKEKITGKFRRYPSHAKSVLSILCLKMGL